MDSKSKKFDNDDEESKGYVEKTLEKDNHEKIDLLGSQVSKIKSITKGIGGQIKEDSEIIKTLDGGFDKTKALVSRTLGRLDTLIT